MRLKDVKDGMRVRFTGDPYNFGEPAIVPPRGAIGTVRCYVSHGDEESNNTLVRWEPSGGKWWYRASQLSQVVMGEF